VTRPEMEATYPADKVAEAMADRTLEWLNPGPLRDLLNWIAEETQTYGPGIPELVVRREQK
jgi:hypothetical protein